VTPTARKAWLTALGALLLLPLAWLAGRQEGALPSARDGEGLGACLADRDPGPAGGERSRDCSGEGSRPPASVPR
jgi:hypothetical protein